MAVDEVLEKVLAGKTENLPPQRSQIVRIFTSSTFTDTANERNTLMRDVYPKLKNYCRSRYGLEFQVVDMRWGVRDEATDDHMTSALCMAEIKACQRLSIGPNFVTFLGQKYGYRPFPPKILATVYDKIIQLLTDHGKSTETFKTWFKLDENASPALYNLQPISSILKYYIDPSEPELHKEDKAKWWDAFNEMQQSFRYAAKRLLEKQGLEREEAMRFLISVTHEEVINGILNTNKDIEPHCIGFVRKISNLQSDLSNKNAPSFIDVEWGKSEVDSEAQDLLADLRDIKLHEKLPASRLFESTIDWTDNGIDPENVKAHSRYIEEFCGKFYNTMVSMIDDGVAKSNQLTSTDDLYQEVLSHLHFCVKQCKSFHGRRNILQPIEDYIQHSCQNSNDIQEQLPLIIHGVSGSGKTSVMAKCTQWTGQSYPHCKIIARFLGTTPNSSSISKTIFSVCQQICRIYDKDETQIPDGYSQLVAYFAMQIQNIPANKPLVIILDSLDQLLPVDGAHRMQWIPNRLPSHVAMVLSTLPYEYDCLAALKQVLPEASYIEVNPLPVDVGMQIIDDWLSSASRTVSQQQREIMTVAAKQCSLPLYLKLVFDQARRWYSYHTITSADLPVTIPTVISLLFDKLERQHGKMLVSRALSYITASPSGVAESELEDLLSCDDVVLQDVYQYWLPPVRRIPPLLWTRIRSEIDEYLVERETDNNRVIYWYHRQFIEVARARYLHNEGVVREIHSLCADYYLGTWANQEKPFKYTDKQVKMFKLDSENGKADRKVPSQPLIFELDGDMAGQGGRVRYNLRKMNELPYHLIKAGRLEESKEFVYCSFNWLLTKLNATSIQELLNDFTMALDALPEEDKEIKLVYQAIRLSASTVITDPRTLAAELVGQLSDRSSGDDCQYLAKLVQQAAEYGQYNYPLMPIRSCLNISGEILQATLEGHTEKVCSLAISHNGLFLASGSEDNTVKVWNIASGNLMHTLTGHHEYVYGLAITADNRMIVSYTYIWEYGKKSPIIVWSLESGDRLMTLRGHTKGKCRLVLTNNCKYAVSGCRIMGRLRKVLPPRKKVKSDSEEEDEDEDDDDDDDDDDTEGNKKSKKNKDEDRPTHDYVIQDIDDGDDSADDGEEADSDDEDENSNWYAVLVWSLESGKLIRYMDGHTKEITAVAVDSSSTFAISSSRDKTARIWDLNHYYCLRVLKETNGGCPLAELAISPDNSLVFIEGLWLGLYDIASGKHLHKMEDPEYSSSVYMAEISPDGKLVGTATSGNDVKFFNVASGEFVFRINGDDRQYRQGMAYFTADSQYVIASLGNDKLSVIDIAKREVLAEFKGHTREINDLKIFRGRGQPFAVTASTDETIKVWNLSDLSSLSNKSSGDAEQVEYHTDYITSVQVTHDNRYYITSSKDNTTKKWDMETGKLVKSLSVKHGPLGYIHETKASQYRQGIAFPSRKTLRYTVDIEKLEVIDETRMPFRAVDCAAISDDGQYIITLLSDRTLIIYTSDFSTIAEHKHCYATDIILLKSNYFLTIFRIQMYDRSGSNKEIKVWNACNGQCIAKLSGHERNIWCLAVTEDEKYAVSGAWDKTLIVWELATFEIYGKMVGHTDIVKSLQLSKNKYLAASGASDNTVRLWDFSTPQCQLIYTLEGHTATIDRLAFLMEDHYLMSISSEENLVKIWNPKQGQLVANFYSHAKIVNFAIAEKKNMLIAATADGRVMPLKINKLLQPQSTESVTPQTQNIKEENSPQYEQQAVNQSQQESPQQSYEQNPQQYSSVARFEGRNVNAGSTCCVVM